MFSKKKLNDKYYKIYNYIFNYNINKFNLINYELLFNMTIHSSQLYILCNKKYYNKEDYYKKVYFTINKNTNHFIMGFNIEHLILNKFNDKKKNVLLISNTLSSIVNYSKNIKYKNNDIIIYQFKSYNLNKINENLQIYKALDNINNIYSSHFINIYKQFLINLKNNNEENNIIIPKKNMI